MKNKPNAKALSIVIPAHEEASVVESVAAEAAVVAESLAPGAWEIVVVDDASSTPIQLRRDTEGSPVRVVRREQRGGSGAARKTGHAETTGDWIAWIDGDGTYPAQELEHLWNMREGWDQIIGARDCDHGQLQMLRLAVKRLACHWTSTRWRRPVPDLNSGLRLFRRATAEAWMEKLPDRFSCTTTATLAAFANGQSVRFVPIRYRARAEGTRSKFHPVTDTWRFFSVVRRWRPPTVFGDQPVNESGSLTTDESVEEGLPSR